MPCPSSCRPNTNPGICHSRLGLGPAPGTVIPVLRGAAQRQAAGQQPRRLARRLWPEPQDQRRPRRDRRMVIAASQPAGVLRVVMLFQPLMGIRDVGWVAVGGLRDPGGGRLASRTAQPHRHQQLPMRPTSSEPGFSFVFQHHPEPSMTLCVCTCVSLPLGMTPVTTSSSTSLWRGLPT